MNTLCVNSDLPQVLNTRDMADFLALSQQTVRTECSNGHIPAKRIGRQWRISRDAFTEWLNGGGSDD